MKIYALIDNDTYIFNSSKEFIEATFNPEINIQFTCKKSLGAYYKGQNLARDYAILWQSIISEESIQLSYGELAIWSGLFETLGKKYGLLREFRENCIC